MSILDTRRTPNAFESFSARHRLRCTRPKIVRAFWQPIQRDIIYLIYKGLFLPDPDFWETLPKLNATNLRPPDVIPENVVPLPPSPGT